MRGVTLAATLAILASAAPTTAATEPHNSAGADHGSGVGVQLRRLLPREMPSLPPKIRDWMTDRAFTIPQSYCATVPNNAFRASIAKAGSRDWVALCSRADTSRIVIFWGGTPDSVTELKVSVDGSHSFWRGGKEFDYSRLIVPASVKSMRKLYSDFEVPFPKGIDHDSLEEVICEKASLVYYWRRGVVEELLGMD